MDDSRKYTRALAPAEDGYKCIDTQNVSDTISFSIVDISN